MKKKQQAKNRHAPSSKHKTVSQEVTPDLTHQFMELLSNKVDQVQSIINETSINLNGIKDKDSNDFDDFDPDDMRIQPPDFESAATSSGRVVIQNDAASNSGQSSAAIAHRTAFQYATPETQSYNYGFTNSEFFAFIGSLDPVEYILVITVIAIIIGVELNVFELQILGEPLLISGLRLEIWLNSNSFNKRDKAKFLTVNAMRRNKPISIHYMMILMLYRHKLMI